MAIDVPSLYQLILIPTEPGEQLKMASRSVLLSKINANSSLITTKLATIQTLIESRKAKVSTEIEAEKLALVKENEDMKRQIQELVNKLNQLEGPSTVKPGAVFADKVTSAPTLAPTAAPEAKPAAPKVLEQKKPPQSKAEQPKSDAIKADGQKPAKAQKQAAPAEPDKPVDVSRLDLRVGRITSVQKHPDADSLYVEQVDLGEAKPRTVVSGLVKFVPIESMSDRLVLLLCNLKPAKMRGVTSEAMVMCASSPDKVEILVPPPGAVVGDRAMVEKYPGDPDVQLNPKKKVWEEVAPDLKTDNNGVACYKGCPIVVAGKGPFKSETLNGVQVK